MKGTFGLRIRYFLQKRKKKSVEKKRGQGATLPQIVQNRTEQNFILTCTEYIVN